MALFSLEAEPGRFITQPRRELTGRDRGTQAWKWSDNTNRTVSREHAEFRLDGGKVTIRDLDSTAGTFINDKRIQRGVWGLGDSVTCGKLEVRVRDLGGGNAAKQVDEESSGGGGGGTAILDAYEPMDLDDLAPAPSRSARRSDEKRSQGMPTHPPPRRRASRPSPSMRRQRNAPLNTQSGR